MRARLESLSEIRIDYWEPEIEVDYMLYKLADGDISKVPIIEELDFEMCCAWYYMIKLKEVNELKAIVAEWEKIREK